MSAAKTNARKAPGHSKPKQEPNLINQVGIQAQALAVEHEGRIGARLTADFLAVFAADLAGLLVAVPAVMTAKAGKVQLTAAQSSALDAGAKLVKGVRTTIKGHEADKPVLLAYGIGTPINKAVVKDVTAAIQKILARVTAEPAEAAAFDLVPADVDALHAALTAIRKADEAQEIARATAPLTTAQRNATARRLLAGIKKIAGAGMRAFADDPAVYANFEALLTKSAS